MVDAYKIGAMGTDTLTGRLVKVLAFNNTINAAGNAHKEGAVGYQVPAGKTFYPTGILLISASTAAHTARLCYADDALMANNRVDVGFTFPVTGYTAGNIPIIISLAGITPIPATKYLGIYNAAAVAVTPYNLIMGYEE